MIDLIAFDADDTLWHNEPIYRDVERQYLEILLSYGLSREEILNDFHKIEIDNLPCFGYGIRGFILSMIEAAVQLTNGTIKGKDIQQIVDLGKRMTRHPIEVLDGVEETLAALNHRRLMLITKGDALDQENKVQRSGLGGYFPVVEVLVDKTRKAYADLLSTHAVDAERFLMVGNSLRSDIVPVLELGGYAVHVPYPMNWAHETEADLPADRSRYFEIQHLRELPGLLAKLEGRQD